MKRIAILSDTHGNLCTEAFKHMEVCDEIWHAGDIGSLELLQKLQSFKPLRSVYGNIDGQEIRIETKATQRFMCEEVDVMIRHIVGYPGRYDHNMKNILLVSPPKLLIAGHSHILKVMYDKKHNLLYINPGAAGNKGFHKVRTLIRLSIDQSDMKDVEVIELGPRSAI